MLKFILPYIQENISRTESYDGSEESCDVLYKYNHTACGCSIECNEAGGRDLQRQRSAGADVGRYVSATSGCRPLERLKVSEVTGVRELSSRPNLASIVVLVLSAFYRTPPPIISYAVCIHHT